MSSAGDAIKTPPTICPDGTVYAGSGNGSFGALTGTTGTAGKQWPLFQRCSRHLDRFGGQGGGRLRPCGAKTAPAT